MSTKNNTLKFSGITPPYLNPGSTSIGSISTNEKFLDTEAIRSNLKSLTNEISYAVSKIKTWLNSKEFNYDFKHLYKEFESNFAQFNQLKKTIPALRQYKNALNGWHTKFQKLTLQAFEYLGKYCEAVVMIESFSSTSVGGFLDSEIDLLKKRLSLNKRIQKQNNIASLYRTKLNTILTTIQTEVDTFSHGSIKYRNKFLHLRDFEKLVDGLTESDFPTTHILTDLSSIVNSSRTTFNMNSQYHSPTQISTTSFPEPRASQVDAQTFNDLFNKVIQSGNTNHNYSRNTSKILPKVTKSRQLFTRKY